MRNLTDCVRDGGAECVEGGSPDAGASTASFALWLATATPTRARDPVATPVNEPLLPDRRRAAACPAPLLTVYPLLVQGKRNAGQGEAAETES